MALVRKSRALDLLLLVPLLALWGACTALHVHQLVRDRLAWVSVYVAPPASDGARPVVRGFWPGAAGAVGDLRSGDRLTRIGDAELAGVGPVGFVARAQAAASARRDLRVPVVYERDGRAAETSIELVPVAFPWRMLPLACTLVATAVLVLLRRPGSRVARAFLLFAVAYALHWTFFFGGPVRQTLAWSAVFLAASLVMLPLILRAALLFPEETAPADGRLPWWPWLFAIFAPISAGWVFGVPLPPELAFRAVFAVNVAFIVALLAVLTRSYRRAGPLGRRQLKWILLGTYAGTFPVLIADVVAAIEPSLWWLHEVAVIAEILVPLSILVAIVRANAFDVDRLITGAAVYSLLSILLLAALLVAVPHVARAASRAADLDHGSVQLLLSLLVATAAVPGSRLLRPRLERVLFHERHALRAGVEDLLRELAAAAGPEELLTLVGERLDALLRPRSCAIYAPLGDELAPVFASAADCELAPPTLASEAAEVLELRTRPGPIAKEALAGGRRQPIAFAQRLALERLGAAAVLPVRRGGELAAAICLGPKRSGDVYTPTDLALLAAVADKVAGELLHFDAADILAQERHMSETLRSYVPDPVVARLTRGQAIEGGERDVSVLFVDLRGYTTYSEAQAAGTVFSMVSRYAEVVSTVIQRRGGTVVEFLGDGLMAVFGAPEAVPDHARVSVHAAFEVVAAVRALANGDGGTHGAAPIEVGVGIASGEAFVGNVRTSDRLVYTAVGDVVNLASRIQGLTRDLGAAVAIDASTHRLAGDAAARFQRHPQVPIRGRAEPVDVFALPAAA